MIRPALASLIVSLCLFSPPTLASALDIVSGSQAGRALKLALNEGASAAISKLGREGGFMENPDVHIPLPATVRKAERFLRFIGQGDALDKLEQGMNRAAELAVPKASKLMISAVKSMSVDDAKQILKGGDDSVTKYFEQKTSSSLREQFLPVISEQLSQLGVAKQYNRIAQKGADLGLVKETDATIEGFVTERTLLGLYKMIATEEKALRQDPYKAGSRLLGKVFGALK